MSAFLAAAAVLSTLAAGPQEARTGDLVLFIARENAGIRQVRFMENSYLPVPDKDKGSLLFLLGVDLDAKEGSYRLSLVMDDGTEKDWGPIFVSPGTFETEELTLPEKMVTPPPETLERIGRERQAAAAVYRESSGEIFWKPPFAKPVDGRGSGNFGKRRILNGIPKSPHSGEDFSSPLGTPVRAAAAGVVAMADDLYYSGKTILIDHGGGLVSQYFHLDDMDVRRGDRVARGEVVGRVGATGRVTGAHLHFGLRLHSMRVDPAMLWSLFGDD